MAAASTDPIPITYDYLETLFLGMTFEFPITPPHYNTWKRIQSTFQELKYSDMPNSFPALEDVYQQVLCEYNMTLLELTTRKNSLDSAKAKMKTAREDCFNMTSRYREWHDDCSSGYDRDLDDLQHISQSLKTTTETSKNAFEEFSLCETMYKDTFEEVATLQPLYIDTEILYLYGLMELNKQLPLELQRTEKEYFAYIRAVYEEDYTSLKLPKNIRYLKNTFIGITPVFCSTGEITHQRALFNTDTNYESDEDIDLSVHFAKSSVSLY